MGRGKRAATPETLKSPGSRRAGRFAETGAIENSFTPGTKVLMADGSTKSIEQVKTGDKVVATDEKTGETRMETVTAKIKGQGVKHLVKVTIDIDGKAGSKTAEVTATDKHPFWVPEVGKWLDAADFQPGQWLRASAGTHVQIAAIDRWMNRSGVCQTSERFTGPILVTCVMTDLTQVGLGCG
jgi:hypothetical protein